MINPATSAVLDQALDASPADAKAAIERSVGAFPAWKGRTPFERSAILRKWFELILQSEDVLARSMTQEMGKPITESRGEVRYAAAFVEWYAEEAKRAYGEVIPTHANHKRMFAMRQ
ncbi:MAG TPA: aldehyde dehydrogenase family protein, partial [Vicinamibacterales bacterium]